MNIAMFTNNFSPHTSGVATSITRLRRQLVVLGHTVDIWTSAFLHYHENDPHIHRVPAIPFPEPVLPFPFFFLPSIARDVRRAAPTIIHTHHPSLLGHAALKNARAIGCPIVMTYHTMYEQYVHYAPPLLPERTMQRIVLRRVMQFVAHMDALVVPSQSVADILHTRGVTTPLHVLPTGVNTNFFLQSEDVRETTRAEFGVQKGEILIVSFGRLSQEKNFDRLLRAFARIRQNIPYTPLRLVIGGDGPARHELETLTTKLRLSDRVRFIGLVPHDRVPSFLSGGDIFAYTSESETQGLVTLEAFAAGLPGVVVDAPGNRDIVVHKKNGVIVQPTDEAVAEGLQQLVEHKNLRQTYGVAARAHADNFSEERMAKRMLEMYQSLL